MTQITKDDHQFSLKSCAVKSERANSSSIPEIQTLHLSQICKNIDKVNRLAISHCLRLLEQVGICWKS